MLFVRCNKSAVESQTEPPPLVQVRPGVVKGTVWNEFNQKIAGAVLTVQPASNTLPVTTVSGSYTIDSLAAGSYTLAVKKDGYVETASSLTITAGDTTTKDFVLKAGTAYVTLLS